MKDNDGTPPEISNFSMTDEVKNPISPWLTKPKSKRKHGQSSKSAGPSPNDTRTLPKTEFSPDFRKTDQWREGSPTRVSRSILFSCSRTAQITYPSVKIRLDILNPLKKNRPKIMPK